MGEAIQTLGAEVARTVGFITDRVGLRDGAGGGGRGFDSPLSPFLFFPLPSSSSSLSSFFPPFPLLFSFPLVPVFVFLFGVGCLVWVVWWCCGVGWVGLCGCCVGVVALGWVLGGCLFGGVCALFVGVVVWFVPSCVCLRVLCMFPVCLLWCEF